MQSSQPGLLRKIPPLLLKPLGFTPTLVMKPVLERGLSLFFRDSMANGELAPLEGRWVCLDIKDAGLKLMLGVQDGKPIVSKSVTTADLTIRGNLEEFVLLAANREDPDTQFFQRRLSIEGDTELGLEVKNLIYSLDPDRISPVVNQILERLGRIIEHTRELGL